MLRAGERPLSWTDCSDIVSVMKPSLLDRFAAASVQPTRGGHLVHGPLGACFVEAPKGPAQAGAQSAGTTLSTLSSS